MSNAAPDAEMGAVGRPDPPESLPIRTPWPAKRLHANHGQRFANNVVSALTEFGLVPHTYVMTTRGRRTGKLHRTPVTLVEDHGQRWLVAPYGPVPWVLNARAAGRVTLRRRGRVEMCSVAELADTDAGPVLQKYLQVAGATRPYFTATKDSPVADFVAEAGQHPVFALTGVDGPAAR